MPIRSRVTIVPPTANHSTNQVATNQIQALLLSEETSGSIVSRSVFLANQLYFGKLARNLLMSS